MNLKINDITRHISLILSIGLLLSYMFGFIIWNHTLASYSFFEYSLLQTRYISAGLLFLFFLIPIIFLLILIFKKWFIKIILIFKKNKLGFLLWILAIYLIMYFLIILALGFSSYFFKKIPQNLGGGKPFVTAMMSTPETIEYLSNFNVESIRNSGNPEVETVPVCNLYQNEDLVIIGVKMIISKESTIVNGKSAEHIQIGYRVLVLKQDQILGYNQRPRSVVEEQICDDFMNWNYGNLDKGLPSEKSEFFKKLKKWFLGNLN